MIKRHSKVNVGFSMSKNYIDKEITGYVSIEILKNIFNLFTWVYRGEDISNAFEEKSNITALFKSFNLNAFITDSIEGSTVVFYNKLKQLVDIRKLEVNVLNFESKNNKLLVREDFKYKTLYNIYKRNEKDIPATFLLFNSIFKRTLDKTIKKIESNGQITSLLTYTDIIRPDFNYKLLKKDLLINKQEEENYQVNEIYIIQDCTLSMYNYIEKIKILKAYILDTALQVNWNVHWIEASASIFSETFYENKNDIQNIEMNFEGSFIDYKNILKEKRFINKKLVIITDGTDDFNFNFSSVSSDINLVTFNENYNLKNKIGAYGKYYIF